MLDKPLILSLFLTRLINSIKHEHSCKILYITFIFLEPRPITVVTHKEECHATTLCMASCKHGYNLAHTGGSSCKDCTCKPGEHICIKSCTHGYNLAHNDGGCKDCTYKPGMITVYTHVNMVILNTQFPLE